MSTVPAASIAPKAELPALANMTPAMRFAFLWAKGKQLAANTTAVSAVASMLYFLVQHDWQHAWMSLMAFGAAMGLNSKAENQLAVRDQMAAITPPDPTPESAPYRAERPTFPLPPRLDPPSGVYRP